MIIPNPPKHSNETNIKPPFKPCNLYLHLHVSPYSSPITIRRLKSKISTESGHLFSVPAHLKSVLHNNSGEAMNLRIMRISHIRSYVVIDISHFAGSISNYALPLRSMIIVSTQKIQIV